MGKHRAVEKNEEAQLEQCWHIKFKITDANVKVSDGLLEILSHFEFRWDGHLAKLISQNNKSSHPRHEQSQFILRRTGWVQKANRFVKKKFDELLAEENIKAQTEWTAPIVLAPKKDGSLCFCVDYGKPIVGTKRDVYPIPLMDECIDSLYMVVILSTLDANSWYREVVNDNEYRDQTDFISLGGCHSDYGIPRALSKEKWMLRFQRLNGSSH